MRTHHPDADVSLIQHAHDDAAVWHAGQTRSSGDPFLTHCLAVAAIVTDIGMPPSVICAAVLHDIDDTPCPPGRVAEHFGQEIADLISAVRTAELAAIPLTALDFGVARSPAFSRRVRRPCWPSASPTGCTTCVPSRSSPRPGGTSWPVKPSTSSRRWRARQA
ncbi:HD domain-containing protein [Streptomyces mirabilis]|uniref:HD domain-containing protein n=1 Tax=Streptomyces mirabilis TaxID=68239 RepID=UPI0036A15813